MVGVGEGLQEQGGQISQIMDVLETEKQHPGDFSKISHIIKGENYR